MNVLPAKIAGVKEIIMVTPPDREGTIPPVIAAAAKVAGVTAIYKVGGAQAIAALAYGTATIPQVDKIVRSGQRLCGLRQAAGLWACGHRYGGRSQRDPRHCG